MTGSYDPLDLAIFNNLQNLAAGIGSSYAQSQEEERRHRLGTEALRKYAEDPSIENYVNAARFADMQGAIKASQALQQNKVQSDIDTGIAQMAQMLGIPPELARVLYENPKMKEFFDQPGAQDPLGHLADDDRKTYQSHGAAIEGHTRNASLAREMRMSGSKAALAEYAQATGMSPALIKKMKKKDIQELGRRVEINELTEAARKQVRMKLYENPNLTPQQRRAYESEILASPEFMDFLANEVDKSRMPKGGLYSPNQIVHSTGQYMDKLFEGQPQPVGQDSTGRPIGRIAMPTTSSITQGTTPQGQQNVPQGTQPQTQNVPQEEERQTTPQVAPSQGTTPQGPQPQQPQPQTPQGTPQGTPPQQSQGPVAPEGGSHDDVLRLIQETLNPELKQPEEQRDPEKPITFRDRQAAFVENAKKYNKYKDWPDEELQAAWQNHKDLSAGKKYLDYRSQASLEDEGPAPSEEQLKGYLEKSLIEDFFFQGVKPSQAKEAANAAINGLAKEDLQKLLGKINNKEDLTKATEYVLNQINKKGEDGNFIDKLPEGVSEETSSQLLDTLVVGGTRGLLAAADQAPLALTTAAAAAAIPGAGPFLTAGVVALNSAGFAWRVKNNLNRSKAYTAFFSQPKTGSQTQKNYEERYRFAERYRDEFTNDERKQLLDGKMSQELSNKVLGLINKEDFVEKSLNMLFRPASTIDEKTLRIAETMENKFPNFNEHAVLAAEMFGSLTSGHYIHSKAVGARTPKQAISQVTKKTKPQPGRMTILTPAGAEIPVKPTTKEVLNNVRKKLISAVKGGKTEPTSGAQKAYEQRWNQWAASKGRQIMEPFHQGGRWFSNSAPFRHAVISGAYGGLDYYLDEALEEPYLARCLLNMGVGGLASGLDYHYYRTKNLAHNINHESNASMFRQFTKDFGGTTSTSAEGQVFDIPPLKRQIVFTPEGTVYTKPSTTPPSNLPEGPVGFKEFNTVQSDNFVSFAGVSKDLGVPIPDFTRTPASKSVVVDERAAHRFVDSIWDHKNLIIEGGRQQDLAPFIDQEAVKKVLGEQIYQQDVVPKTEDLKTVAKHLYEELDTQAQAAPTKATMNRLRTGLTSMAHYFEDHPSLGASFGKAKTLFDDTYKHVFREHFTVKDLIDYHRAVNKQKHKVQLALEKDYSPDNQLLSDFYTALDTMLVRALPKEMKDTLRKADNMYYAYKYSEELDDIMKTIDRSNLSNWLEGKSSFKNLSERIYKGFKNSHVSNALRKALVHDDYLRNYFLAPNVEVISDGNMTKNSRAIENVADFSGGVDGLRKAAYFTPAGKPVGLGMNVLSNMKALGKLDVQKRGIDAMKSSPFAISADIKPLILASRRAHNLRDVQSPFEKRSKEKPDIVSQIDAYGKLRRKVDRAKAKAEMQRQAAIAAEKKKKEEEKKRKAQEAAEAKRRKTQEATEAKKRRKEEDKRKREEREERRRKELLNYKLERDKAKIEAAAKVEIANINAEAKIGAATAKTEGIVAKAKADVEIAESRTEAEIAKAEAGVKKEQEKTTRTVAKAEAQTEKYKSEAETLQAELDLEKEKTGLARDEKQLGKALADLTKAETKERTQDKKFAQKQKEAKRKYINLTTERTQLMTKAMKTKDVKERKHLFKLIEGVHKRIGNLRPYIPDEIIQGFDLAHEQAKDFLDKFYYDKTNPRSTTE